MKNILKKCFNPWKGLATIITTRINRYGLPSSSFQSLKGISDYYNQSNLPGKILSWMFQSLKGISDYYNVSKSIPVVIIKLFQSLKGISDYYNAIHPK